MPGGDGTGPWGQGAGTGWGRGGCVARGRRFSGRAFGAFRNFFAPSSYSAKEELEELEAELATINSRISEIKKEKK
ncbi:hypothetical protein A2526_05215 [candidate division WOR-1 bacterium RIFOXYD2_FULL_36_8]|uniref:DUF5320 domain-containing protein n=1 Tax=candidate division WOR-1 bacterium RIFOXYB2_FULL_36_35 TaxID=1802578 RepID=A0A1F4S0Z3_UNCSA|nr:MAG: hypothetical protein A2230_00660 [candidate division WOR-1 bacterium RIFOXYA2_FULL_36_21]OGC14101.1 MAG: hypothetical protein A2290_06325 [candidate division WOR-1 bacterium RIFOXYB2_FULL_36_35]OGC16523.1 MAG: hypothetical protein A2282_02185 [candidate division WOR-1 bacterium RIFOXYA12_FULL_36_13]OGC39719.1 MAG: hypothetical protein A2526_05215 [candidate division WOR-1 bacterium RIFOXYD2_FULL_36_8]